jgi:hypothetical protein
MSEKCQNRTFSALSLVLGQQHRTARKSFFNGTPQTSGFLLCKLKCRVLKDLCTPGLAAAVIFVATMLGLGFVDRLEVGPCRPCMSVDQRTVATCPA